MIRYITYIIALLLATSCSKEISPIIEQESEAVRNIAFGMVSKADDKPRSYCFALYSSNTRILPQYGFYTSDIITSVDGMYSWLTPTEVDGNFGLAAADGTYAMSAVSPAAKPTSAKAYWELDLSTSSEIVGVAEKIFGYLYNRVPEDDCDNDQLFIGDPTSIYIEGALASTESDKTTYNYKFEEGYTLKQQRTKFQLKARVGSLTDQNDNPIKLSYDISSIYISNVVNTALFNPTVGYYAINMDGKLQPFTDFQNDDKITIINQSESKVLDVTTEENVDNDNYFYLISADYSDQERYPMTPTLNVEFYNGLGSIKTVPIPLDVDFKPQYYYTFDLVISSLEITLSVSIESWDGENIPAADVDEITGRIITVSLEDDGWESGSGDSITGVINDLE